MSYLLVMTSTDGTERPFPLEKERTLIGFEPRCDVRIPIPSVSRQHCEIRRDGDSLRVTDLASNTGTYCNGQRIMDAVLGDMDTLTVGPVTFIVRRSNSADGKLSVHVERTDGI